MPTNPFMSYMERLRAEEEAKRRISRPVGGMPLGTPPAAQVFRPQALTAPLPRPAPVLQSHKPDYQPSLSYGQMAGPQAASVFRPTAATAPQAGNPFVPAAKAATGGGFTDPPYARPNFQPGLSWAKSYKDPVYDLAEARAVDELGVDPKLGHLVSKIRLMGEKTDNGVTSSAGANTPYQFIPGTRELFIKKHGIDPWADPTSGAKAAILHIKESMDRGASEAEAVAEYIGGPNFRNSKNPGVIRDYVSRVMGPAGPNQAGMTPDFANPFTPGPWKEASNKIEEAGRLASQPFSATFDMPTPPAFPDAPVLPDRDFSKTDQMMQDLKPVFDLSRDKGRIERGNLFAGLAKGLASIPEGAGLGTVLGRVGAGMLAGRGAADMEIQARMDAFDDKMTAWKMAEMNYEGNKSNTLFSDAVNEVKTMFDYNLSKFNAGTAQFNKDHSVTTNDTGFVLTNRQPDGKMRVDLVPIAPLVAAKTALNQAELAKSIGQAMQQGASIEAAALNNFIIGQIGADRAAAGGGQQSEGQILVTSGYFLASQLFDSKIAPEVIGVGNYSNLRNKAMAQYEASIAGNPTAATGIDPKTAESAITEIMVMKLTEQMANDPALAAKIKKEAPRLFERYWVNRVKEKTTTETVNAKGQTSTSTRY